MSLETRKSTIEGQTFQNLKKSLGLLDHGELTAGKKSETLAYMQTLLGPQKNELSADSAINEYNYLKSEIDRIESDALTYRAKQIASGALDVTEALVVGTVGNVLTGGRATGPALEVGERGINKIKGDKNV